MVLTEKDAAIAYAKAWNRLDCSEFLKLLDDNAHNASQWVFRLFDRQMKTVKVSASKVFAEF